MMKGYLLDSHSMVWLNSRAPMLATALSYLDAANRNRSVFVSHITLWETGVAIQKKNPMHRPDLGGLSVQDWFKGTVERFQLRTLPISSSVALEAGRLPPFYGSGDPGDCFLIATAHVRNLALVTRDRRIQQFAAANPSYLSVMPC